jgi:hypothetical protein
MNLKRMMAAALLATSIEEFIFFDHPSTRFRIHDAMRWREAMGTP